MRRTLLCALLALAAAPVALAQGSDVGKALASAPFTIVAPFPPGGPVDTLARMLSAGLAERYQQPAVVENRTGADGNIGIQKVRDAKPDGHTLLVVPQGNLTINPTLKPAFNFNIDRDYVPVASLARTANVVAVNPAVPAKTIAELVALSKAKPDSISYASPGVGSSLHLAGELFRQQSGADILHVAYKGTAPGLNDVLGGQVPMTVMTLGPIAPFLTNGKIAALAVMDSKRSPLAPQVPTMAEAGFKTLDGTAWQGLFAPKGTPAAVVSTLNQHMNAILQMPDVVAKMATFGALPAGGETARLEKTNADDHARYTRLVKEFGIQAD